MDGNSKTFVYFFNPAYVVGTKLHVVKVKRISKDLLKEHEDQIIFKRDSTKHKDKKRNLICGCLQENFL